MHTLYLFKHKDAIQVKFEAQDFFIFAVKTF